MQTGTRGATPVSPMNRTGQIYREQQREKQARDKAASVDIETIKRAEYERGWDAGYDAGVAAVIKQLQADGVIDADEVEEA